MDDRENLRRAILFERPERIPMSYHINAACWAHYGQDALEELMATHPLLFPGFKPRPKPYKPAFGPCSRADQPFTDPWGCVWKTTENGITGAVTEHPLADWGAFDSWVPPDPEGYDGLSKVDWEKKLAGIRKRKKEGHHVRAGLRHGHTFLALTYIRGYENLIYDMADEEPKLWELIEIVEAFNLNHVKKFVAAGVDMMGYPEDLGMQKGPMLSPQHLRKYIKPSYERLMAPAREAGVLIHMHSDGDIRDLADDLIDSGVQSLNLQDLVNGIDWIADRFKGKVCIDLDIDRQNITRFGTPEDIDVLIRQEVETLGSPEGGLMMVFGMYPGMPLENAKALMDAMEKYAAHWS